MISTNHQKKKSVIRLAFRCLIICFAAIPPNLILAPFALSVPLSMPGSIPALPDAALHTVLDEIGTQRDLVIEIQRELISRPALNPEHGGEGEDAKARWIEGWLAGKHNIQVRRVDFPDDRVPSKVRPNLILRYPAGPRAENTRTVWLLAQLDSSPPEDYGDWQGSPHSLRVTGDTLHGNGVEENNQGVAVSLLLLETLHKHDISPLMNLGVVLTAGEQIGPDKGLGFVLGRFPDLFAPGDLFLLFDYGDNRGGIIEVAEKQYYWLKIAVIGKPGFAGHAGAAVNPVTAGAELITALAGLATEFPQQDPLFKRPSNFFTPTRVESSNVSVNYVPERFTFSMDARLLPSCDAGEVEQAIRRHADAVEKKYGVLVELEELGKSPSAPATPAEAPVILALTRAIQAQLGVNPALVGRGGVTMATALRHRGLHAACWSIHRREPGVATENASITAHLEQARVLCYLLFDRDAARMAAPSPIPAPRGEKSGEGR